MFTGIIETTGIIEQVISQNGNVTFWISSPFSNELRIDQSVSHDGVCLTVEEVSGDRHKVTAIPETLEVSTASSWKPGKKINLERCLIFNGRLDGHLVQGHVDAKATCIQKLPKGGSIELSFQIPERFAPLIIEKGSISLNGISLTIFDVTLNQFNVAIIPYTWEHTNLKFLEVKEEVNVEFDLIGKYVARLAELSR